MGQGGLGDWPSVLDEGPFGLGSRLSAVALSRSMIGYEQSPYCVTLKTTWKGNICFLMFVAAIVCATVFVLMTK